MSHKPEDLSIADVEPVFFKCPDCGMILHREGDLHKCSNCKVYYVPKFNHQARIWELDYVPMTSK